MRINSRTIKKYLDGSTSQSERRRVFDWIKQSAENEKEFKLMRRMHDIAIWHGDNNALGLPKTGKRLRLPFFLKIASVLFMGIFVALLYIVRNEISDYLRGNVEATNIAVAETKQITVLPGEQEELLLSDGTRVWLNSQSTFTFPIEFVDSQRVVTLKGEAYFDVAYKPDNIFKVITANHAVTVLGTEFNVKEYDGNRFEASLLRGSVEVELYNSGKEVVRLEPNQTIVDRDNQITITSVNEDEFLWREGILFLDNKTVKDIAPIMKQYYGVKLDIRKQSLSDARYTGKFRIRDGAEQILKVLQIRHNFSYHINEDSSEIVIE